VYDFLFVIIELFSLALTVKTLQAKRVKRHCFQKGVGQFEPRFQGKGSSIGNISWFLKKLNTFCYLTVQTAPCYVQSFALNTGV